MRALRSTAHARVTFIRPLSKTKGRVTVKPDVDIHLDQLRAQLAQLPALLDGVASELRKEPAFRSTSRQVRDDEMALLPPFKARNLTYPCENL